MSMPVIFGPLFRRQITNGGEPGAPRPGRAPRIGRCLSLLVTLAVVFPLAIACTDQLPVQGWVPEEAELSTLSTTRVSFANQLDTSWCMTVEDPAAVGARLVVSSCTGTANQSFEWTTDGELRHGGLCVHAYGGRGRNGDQLVLWSCNGESNQKWQLSPASELKGIKGKCIDVDLRMATRGALILWRCHGGANQKWIPTELSGPSAAIWRMGYYPGWTQGRMPVSEVDWSALSHVAHFSVLPLADGGVDARAHELTPSNTQDVIGKARAAGVKVLLTVGGAYTRPAFLGATNEVNRARFIENLIDHMRQGGYHGLDIDWEPMQEVDFPQFRAFIAELSAELGRISPRPLLSVAVLQSDLYAPLMRDLQQHFDMINLMTYDMSGPWDGWVTWHNSPLYNGGARFPCCSRELPSADLLVHQFVAAGVDRSKLGIGIAFYGMEWVGGEGTTTGGVTEPRQSWTEAPVMTPGEIKYWQIMEGYYEASKYRWDDVAEVPYLSFDNPGSDEDRFISYENEGSVKHKVKYAIRENIGGVIIWELSGGYFTTRPAGSRDPLLQAVKSAYQEGM